MKKIVTNILKKYNGAFGYHKACFAAAGIPAIALIVYLIWEIFFRKTAEKTAEETAIVTGLLIAGIVVLLISVLIILHTRAKCPPDRKNVVVLLLNMVAVAFLGGWIRHNRAFFKGVFQIIEATSVSSGSSGFSNQYQRNGDGAYFHLHSDNGSYAYLSGNGGLVEVRPHGSDGLVCDNAGNLYYPC